MAIKLIPNGTKSKIINLPKKYYSLEEVIEEFKKRAEVYNEELDVSVDIINSVLIHKTTDGLIYTVLEDENTDLIGIIDMAKHLMLERILGE